jgi:hypothetical protein
MTKAKVADQGPLQRKPPVAGSRLNPSRVPNPNRPKSSNCCGAPSVRRFVAIMNVTGWQQHSVRGFFAGVVLKKLGLILESDKPDDGDRIYRIVASTSGKAKVKPNPDRQGA